jgi:hypothetical protein
MYQFDRFAICEAYYMFATTHHEGQWSPTYRIFGRLDAIGFRPRPSLNGPDDLEDDSREIYDNLVGGVA